MNVEKTSAKPSQTPNIASEKRDNQEKLTSTPDFVKEQSHKDIFLKTTSPNLFEKEIKPLNPTISDEEFKKKYDISKIRFA